VVSAVRAVEVPVLVCFLSGCSNVTEVGGTVGFVRLALKVVMGNNGDFVEVIPAVNSVIFQKIRILFLGVP
jgi:hypothetical protein